MPFDRIEATGQLDGKTAGADGDVGGRIFRAQSRGAQRQRPFFREKPRRRQPEIHIRLVGRRTEYLGFLRFEPPHVAVEGPTLGPRIAKTELIRILQRQEGKTRGYETTGSRGGDGDQTSLASHVCHEYRARVRCPKGPQQKRSKVFFYPIRFPRVSRV